MDHNAASRAMLDGLSSHLRDALREKFNETAKEVVEQAVRDGMAAFETSLVMYFRPDRLGHTVEVLLRDRRTGSLS